MIAVALDASGDLEFIAVVYGKRVDLEKFQAELREIGPLHMRGIGKARRQKLSISFLKLLRDKGHLVKVLCFYTGIHNLRKKLKTRRITSSKVELELKRAIAIMISRILLQVSAENIEADTEVMEVLKTIGLRCERGSLIGLADVAAWMNRRYHDKHTKPYAKLFIEKDLSPEIERIAKRRLRR